MLKLHVLTPPLVSSEALNALPLSNNQAGSLGGAGLVMDSELTAARVNRHKAEHLMMGERECCW